MSTREKWEAALATLLAPNAEASERVKALEGLQQLLDGITSASLEDRLALFKRTFDALQTLLGDRGSEQPDAAAAVRSAAFQLLGKVQLAAAVSRSGEHFDHFRQLVANYFDLVFKATSTENEENALICVKALQQLFRTIRSVLLQMPDANMGFDAMLERVVDDFTERLGRVEDTWQRRLAESLEADKAAGAARGSGSGASSEGLAGTAHSATSLKVLSELATFVMSCINSLATGPVAKDKCKVLRPLAVACLGVVAPAAPPGGMLASTFLTVLEDLAFLKVRLFGLMLHLAPPKANLIKTDDPELIDRVIALLHTRPLSTTNSKEVLMYSRHLFAKVKKLPPDDELAAHVRERLPDLVGGGALFTSQRNATNRTIAHSLVQDVLQGCLRQLPAAVLDGIMDAFAAELLDTRLAASVHVKAIDVLRGIQEHLAAAARTVAADGGAPGEAAAMRTALSKTLTVALFKLQQQSVAGANLLEQAKAEEAARAEDGAKGDAAGGDDGAKQPAAARVGQEERTIGKPSRWVADVEAIESPSAAARTELSRKLDTARGLVTRLLQSVYHTLHALQTLSAGPEARAPPLSALELRHLADAITGALPVLALGRAGPATTSPNALYEAVAHVLHCLGTCEFADVFAARFAAFFAAACADGHVVDTLSHCFKHAGREQQRGSAPKKHAALAAAALRYLTESELAALDDPDAPRTKTALRVSAVVFDWMHDVDDIKTLTPAISDLVSACLRHVRTRRRVDAHLELLRQACAVVATKTRPGHRPLIDHLVASGTITAMLHLLLDMLDGPNCAGRLRERVVELCLLQPYHLQDMIKLGGLARLMRPLRAAFRSERDALRRLALATLESWADSLNPTFLEPKIKPIMADVLEALSELAKHPEFARKAMSLLGKLGGRSHSHLNGPQDLAHQANPEQGLRATLTFSEPSTTFLLPLDRIITFVTADGGAGAAGKSVHFRRQALEFVRTCLSTMLSLEARSECLEGTDDAAAGEKLVEVLIGAAARPPSGPGGAATAAKTKLQQQAEEQCFQMLIAAALTATGDPAVADVAEPFVAGVFTHVALLYTSGRARSQYELGISGSWSSTTSRFAPHTGASPRELNMRVALQGLVSVLTRDDERSVHAAVKALDGFIGAVLTAAAARAAAQGGAAADGGEGDGMDVDEATGGKADEAEGDAPKAAAGPSNGDGAAAAAAAAKPKAQQGEPAGRIRPPRAPVVAPALQCRLPLVLDDMVSLLLHACHGVSWAARVGGIAGLKIVTKRLPAAYVRPWSPQLVAAVARVLSGLPEHATTEVATVCTLLREVIFKACGLEAGAAGGGDAAAKPDPEAAAAAAKALLDADDADMQGLLDQVAMALLSQGSSHACRAAALDIIHALCARTQLTPAEVLGDRWKQPWIDVASLSLFTKPLVVKRNQAASKVVLTRIACAAAQTWAAFVSLTPCVMDAPTMCNAVVEEALELLPFDDQQLQRIAIGSRKVAGAHDPCLRFRIAFLDLLIAALRQPAWRAAPANAANKHAATELLLRFAMHSSPALADPSYEALKDLLPELLRDEEGLATVRRALAAVFRKLNVALPGAAAAAPPADAAPAPAAAVAQHLNSVTFLARLGGLLRLLPEALVPRSLGEVLLHHLATWLQPWAMMDGGDRDPEKGAPARANLPASWRPGDELRVPAAVLALFHLLPASSVELLSTAKTAEGKGRHGLVVLSIELEQILEKYTHGELPAASKLSSPLREPLIAFFCKHPHATVAYFLADQRLFSERQDYFWLLHDLSLHPKGGCLLDALCASTDLWHPILDLAIADLTADAAAPCPERYFGILHLMAAVATARPQWLSQRPDLWGKVNVFWQHPGLRARLGALQRHGVRERAEAALLARLVLSYVHENAGELPRVLDLFAVFEQPVYADLDFLTAYCADTLPTHFAPDALSALLRTFITDLPKGRWSSAAEAEIVERVVAPLMATARDRGTLDAVLPTPLLDTILETLAGPPDADIATRMMQHSDIRAMCARQRVIHLVLEGVPVARWQKHARTVINLIWKLLRVRKEEPLKDMSLLTAAKYFKFILPLRQERAHGRLSKHYLQIFVNLLMSSGPEHDSAMVYEAVATMMPCLGAYDVSGEGEEVPTWVNYVRKIIMDNTDAGSSSSGSGFASIAHMWRIVLSYADAFYPHIAFFDVQFVLCMARMIASAPTASITFLSHLVELWPVVLDMALCMAYWLRNVLAGRPLTREAAGAHGGKRSWSASDDKDAAGDEPPRQRHAGVGADGAPADTPAAASGKEVADASEGADAGREAIEPDDPAALARLAEVKLEPQHLETLATMPIRMALLVDRSNGRARAAAAQARSIDQYPQAARLWARAVHVLRVLLTVLPRTQLKVRSSVLKAFKDAQAAEAPNFKVHSVTSTVLHLATFAYASPGFLDAVLGSIEERVPYVLQAGDPATVDDLCALLRTFHDPAALARLEPAAAEQAAKFVAEVTCRVEATLGSVAKDDAPQTALVELSQSTRTTRVKLALYSALRVLDALLQAPTVSDTVAHLTRLLPRIFALAAQILKDLSDRAGHDAAKLLATIGCESAAQKGLFLSPLLLIARILHSPAAARCLATLDATAVSNVSKGCSYIAQALQHPLAPSAVPEVLDEAFRLLRNVMAAPEGGAGGAPSQFLAMILRRLADMARAQQHRSGLAPSWLHRFEDLLYDICVNKDDRYNADVAKFAYEQLESRYVIGLASSRPEMRARFLQLFDARFPAALPDRLRIIVQEERWRLSSHRFWLKNALDMLLVRIRRTETIRLAPQTATAPPLLPPAPPPPRAADKEAAPEQPAAEDPTKMEEDGDAAVAAEAAPKAEPVAERGPESAQGQADAEPSGRLAALPDNAKALITGHVAFLRSSAALGTRALVASLLEVAEGDDRVAYHLWRLVFPIIWTSLSKQLQLSLAKPIINLISKFSEEIAQEAYQPPERRDGKRMSYQKSTRACNVVQALMESVTLSQPQPKFPPELIKFLAKVHSAWHVAIPLLETHVIIFPSDTRCFHALAELYRLVQEDDLLYGLWKNRLFFNDSHTQHGSHPELPAAAEASGARSRDYQLGHALTLAQLGQWQDAAAALCTLNQFYEQQYEQAHQQHANGVPPDHVHGKGQLVLEEWIHCLKQLNRWEELYEIAKSCNNPRLSLNCQWRLGHWEELLHSLKHPAFQENTETSIIKAYALVRTSPGDTIDPQMRRIALHIQAEWTLLPPHCINPKIAVLQCMQQMCEVDEGLRIVRDIRTHMREGAVTDGRYVDMCESCETWRLRTPAEQASLLHWATIIRWRAHIYDYIVSSFAGFEKRNPALYSLGFKDKSWSVNTLARIARKHCQPMLANRTISSMYQYPTMEVSEAFAKIREQCKAYCAAPEMQAMGLSLVNNTNLSYFKTAHKAEMFKLKGMLYEAQDDIDKANQLFFTSVHLKDDEASSWLCWGRLCAARYERALLDAQKAQQAPNANPEMIQQLGAKQREYGENALACFFQALRHDAAAAAPIVPRMLAMLAFNSNKEPRDRAAAPPLAALVKDEIAHGFPASVLLPHIATLVESLLRGERETSKRLLNLVAGKHPQALYLPMRTSLLQLRDCVTKWMKEEENARTGDQGARRAAAQECKGLMEVRAFEHGKDLMDTIRSRPAIVASNIERFVIEVGTKFIARPEERLLNVVHSLLQRCYKLPLPQQADVPEYMKKELQTVCDACLSHEMQVSWRRRGMLADVRESFVGDVQPQRTTTLKQLMDSLKRWITKLLEICEAKFPVVTHLEHEYPALASLDFSDMELPGQCQQMEYNPESVVYIERLASNVVSLRRHCISMRRIELVCSDGASRFFSLHTGQTQGSMGNTDQRVMAVFRAVNAAMARFPEARRRHLQLHAPIILAVWPQARLVQEERSFATYGEVYENNCARYGRDIDRPILYFKEQIHANVPPEQPLTSEEARARQLKAYTDIVERPMISEQVFAQTMFKSLPTPNHTFTFRKQFCAQLALTALFSYLFNCAATTPSKLLFAKASGRVFLQDMLARYSLSSEGRQRAQELPYRFTRNFHTFLTPFGVEGWFLVAQVVCAQAMLQPKQELRWVLALFFRDDITAQNRRNLRQRAKQPEDLERVLQHIASVMAAHLDDAMDRIRDLAGASGGGGGGGVDGAAGARAGGFIDKARSLISAATDPKRLCAQDPSFHPWF